MGSGSSRDTIQKEIQDMIANPVIGHVLPPDVTPIEDPVLDTPEVIQQLENIPYEEIPKKRLAQKIVELSDILLHKLSSQTQSPAYQFSRKLFQLTKGNAEAALEALKLAGGQLGVERHLIRDANLQNERSVRKLARAVVKLLSIAVSLFTNQIVLKVGIHTYSVARFGISPHLIKYLYHYSGLSITGLASGAACMFLVGRFMYLHPTLVDFLRRFKDEQYSEYFIKNMDLTIAAIALQDVLRNETAFMLENSYYLTDLREDLKMLVPVAQSILVNSAGALDTTVRTTEWANETVSHMIRDGTANTTRTFVYWLQNKTSLVGYLIEIVSNITGVNYIKNKVVEASKVALRKMAVFKTKAVDFLQSTESGKSVYEAGAKMYDTLSKKLSWVSDYFGFQSNVAIEHKKEATMDNAIQGIPEGDISALFEAESTELALEAPDIQELL